ncbi:hypothetical protein C8R44DRAFT_243530 [Mycena epipterygia]|nr:hypothetical protein C8R44DRAFT_243530 [Mycena epipterygia]
MHCKEFKAWITIDGKEAVEYDVQTSEDQKTVTCWIASELGKTFSVNWENSSYRHDVIGDVKMDGNHCAGDIIYGHLLPKTVCNKGVSDGTTIKVFMFSSLEMTDDDTYLGQSSHQELGVIQLAIYPIRITRRNTGPSGGRSLSNIKVHERTKKAVTQQITLGNPEELADSVSFSTFERTGPDLAIFSFNYRPIDVLRANGIAPAPPQLKRKAAVEPERAPTPDDDSADAEEARILREKLAALEAKRIKKEKEKKPRVKHEAGAVIDLTQDTRNSKKVKLEARRPFIPGEIIDLT